MKNPTFNYKVTKITREEMNDPKYFALDEYISNSKIGLLNPSEGGSYTKYKNGFTESLTCFDVGGGTHRIVLENHIIDSVEKPSGKIAAMIDYLVEQEKLFPNASRDEILNAGSQVLGYYAKSFTDKRREKVWTDGEEYYNHLKEIETAEANRDNYIILNRVNKKAVIDTVSSIKRNKNIMSLLAPTGTKMSLNEDVILMEVIVDGEKMKFKSKIDNWTIDTKKKEIVLNDLKTTGKPITQFPGYNKTYIDLWDGKIEEVEKKAPGSFHKFHYYRQMAMYLWMLMEYLKDNMDLTGYTIKVNMLVAETIKGHRSQVFEVTDKWLDAGMDEFSALIRYYKKCKNTIPSKNNVIVIE